MSKRIQVFCALTVLSAVALAATGGAGAEMNPALSAGDLLHSQADVP